VKGHVVFEATELDDMILRRADGAPIYNFAVVVDDVTMGVTHVIRGDDHVNNTPRQILIYRALGEALPVFGHVPMILGPDRQKLSKRHGAKAVIDYEQDGLLPEALLNYLVRLGWSHGDQELFSRRELVDFFDGANLNSAPAAFDPEKLLWVNAQHLRSAKPDELLPLLLPFLVQAGISDSAPDTDNSLILRCIPLVQPRVNTLLEMAEQLRPLLSKAADLAYDQAALAKALDGEGAGYVKELRERLANLPFFDREAVHACIHGYVEEKGIKFKALGPPLRLSLLGAPGGPDLADVMAALGQEESLARLDRALAMRDAS